MNEWINGPVLSDSKQTFWNVLKDKVGDLENQPKEKYKPICWNNAKILVIIKSSIYLLKSII